MDLVLLIHALILGLVEGLTEFLPVSSTGHLIVVGEMLDFTGARAETFEVFIQLGAILAVVWHFRARLLQVARHLPRPSERRFALNVAIAFLPAAVLGFALHGYIKAYLFNPITVAIALIVGGVAILLVEYWYRHRQARVQRLDDMSYADALKVGVAQTLSLFPGVSRAGATILGGLVTGLSRTAATEFSFFLAIPTMFAATLFDLYQSAALLNAGDALVFAVGFVTAFASALIVVKTFLAYVSRYTFVPFAWYRIGFGALVLAIALH
jgi:undecaprenyl-diphosphatase